MTFTVHAYRADTGEHIDHLDRTFDNIVEAQAHALASNCKAFTPFFFLVRETAA